MLRFACSSLFGSSSYLILCLYSLCCDMCMCIWLVLYHSGSKYKERLDITMKTKRSLSSQTPRVVFSATSPSGGHDTLVFYKVFFCVISLFLSFVGCVCRACRACRTQYDDMALFVLSTLLTSISSAYL